MSGRVLADERASLPRSLLTPALVTTAVVAAATFWVAYDDGGYSLAFRSAAALAVWWAILLGTALGIWPRERLTPGAIVPGAFLAAFAAWALASTAWSASAEDAFGEFDRTALYLGIYTLVIVSSGRRAGPWIDGLTLAIAAIAAVALISRFFPGSFPARGLPELLPNASTRLSFPLGYWNGLGTFVGLAVPLLLCSTLARVRARRLTAIGALPALGGVVYLASSRGALAAIGAGTLVFVLAQKRRWAALGSCVVAGIGVGAVVAVLAPRHELVDGPLASAAARSEGWQAAILVLVVCVATAAAFEAARALLPRLPHPSRRLRSLCVAAIVALAVAAVVREAHAFEDFTRLPAGVTPTASAATVAGHLLSGGGNGRWQFWTAAYDEFLSAPVQGRGAGSFADWWAQHASFAYFVQDAHSLYLQTLGELGIVGLALLVGALASGVVVGARRLRAGEGAERTAMAGLLGAFTVYLVGAGLDWMWELTAVTAVAICVLGLLAGPATLPGPPHAPRKPRRWLTVAAAALACGVLVAEAISLLTDLEVGRSQAAVRSGNLGRARSDAIAATLIEPWAATPYLQLALVDEASGGLVAARGAIADAIRRDADDWRPWYAAAGIQTRLGDAAAAARSLARARSLDPLSPLFSRGRSS